MKGIGVTVTLVFGIMFYISLAGCLSLTPILYGLGVSVIPYTGVKSGSPASSGQKN